MNTHTQSGESHNVGVALSAFVAGAAIGAAAALILAPTSGRDTRDYLKRRSNEFGRDAMARGRETWRQQSQRVKSAIATGWDRGRDAVNHARERGVAAYREAREPHHAITPGAGRTTSRSEPYRVTE